MKLSVESYEPAKRFGNEESFRLIKDAGFDAVDCTFDSMPDNRNILRDETYAEKARALRAYLDEIGLECNQAHAPHNFVYGEDTSFNNPKYVELVRSIEAAAILGAKSIIVHAIRENCPDFDFFTPNYPFFKSLQPYCEKFGIRVAVENLWIFDPRRKRYTGVFGTPGDLTEFVKALGCENFCACLDIGHAALCGIEPEDFISAMSNDVLTSLHVHDTFLLVDDHTLPYLGLHNWDGITKALADIDYKGDFTLEVLGFFSRTTDELMPAAYRYAEETGRYLVSRIESCK